MHIPNICVDPKLWRIQSGIVDPNPKSHVSYRSCGVCRSSAGPTKQLLFRGPPAVLDDSGAMPLQDWDDKGHAVCVAQHD